MKVHLFISNCLLLKCWAIHLLHSTLIFVSRVFRDSVTSLICKVSLINVRVLKKLFAKRQKKNYSCGWTNNGTVGLAIRENDDVFYLPSNMLAQYCDECDVKKVKQSDLKIDLCAGVVLYLFNVANVFASNEQMQNEVSLQISSIKLVFNEENVTFHVIEGRSDDELRLSQSYYVEIGCLMKNHGLLVWGENWQIVVKNKFQWRTYSF